jgi:pyruvate formate lyase activating enzyme
MEKLVDMSDMVLLDLKIIDPELHRELTGVELETVLESARMISGRQKTLWVRTPVIPGCTDSAENISGLSRFIKGLQSVERYDLLAFNNTCGAKYRRLDMEWKLEGAQLVTDVKMEELASIAREAGVPNVHWSGATAIDKV